MISGLDNSFAGEQKLAFTLKNTFQNEYFPTWLSLPQHVCQRRKHRSVGREDCAVIRTIELPPSHPTSEKINNGNFMVISDDNQSR